MAEAQGDHVGEQQYSHFDTELNLTESIFLSALSAMLKFNTRTRGKVLQIKEGNKG